MRHSKTTWKNILFVANAYLPSYIPNNVNALITFIVLYFFNYIPHFLHICLALPLWRAPPPPPKPPWVRIISLLFVNPEAVWSCCVHLERAPLPDADGNIASAT